MLCVFEPNEPCLPASAPAQRSKASRPVQGLDRERKPERNANHPHGWHQDIHHEEGVDPAEQPATVLGAEVRQCGALHLTEHVISFPARAPDRSSYRAILSRQTALTMTHSIPAMPRDWPPRVWPKKTGVGALAGTEPRCPQGNRSQEPVAFGVGQGDPLHAACAWPSRALAGD